MKRFNWPIALGFLLCVVAFLSYPLLFIYWDVTRDFPWANLVLFAAAGVLLFVGLRRAFAPQRRWLGKTVATVLTLGGVLGLALFIFFVFFAARRLPASPRGAPGHQKAAAFTPP